MEWDILVTTILLIGLAVNNYTYFYPKPPEGVEESGGEKKMPTKNYKKPKKPKRKDKGRPLGTFSSDCAKACYQLKKNK
jgi:hypothetical protein